MTNQDVINFLNQIRKILLDDNSWLESTIQPINETFDMAISAIEKQIPKKPDEVPVKDNDNLWHLYCPSCKNWIGRWNSMRKRGDMYNNSNRNICPYCGQAIDCSGPWTSYITIDIGKPYAYKDFDIEATDEGKDLILHFVEEDKE